MFIKLEEVKKQYINTKKYKYVNLQNRKQLLISKYLQDVFGNWQLMKVLITYVHLGFHCSAG